MQQAHLGLFDGAPTLAMIAMWAGGHQVVPGVLASQVAWDNVIDSQGSRVLTTILAGVVIASQDLALGELDPWAGAMDHFFQSDNGWARVYLPNGLDLAASIEDQAGFSINNEGDGTAGIADVDRLEVSVENQYGGLHSCL